MLIRARHYATGEPVEIVCEGGRIQAINPQDSPVGAESASNMLEADWVAPALFDLQINGCDGHSFNSEKLTAASVRYVVDVESLCIRTSCALPWQSAQTATS